MSNENKIKIFLVDDDALFLKLLENEFVQHTEYSVETYLTGEQCLANLPYAPDIVILDYHLNGINKNAMNGMQTLDEIKTVNEAIPVVMLSSQDSIDVAVNCLHHHAFDYIVKSETAFIRLQKTIASIVLYKKMAGELSWYRKRM